MAKLGGMCDVPTCILDAALTVRIVNPKGEPFDGDVCGMHGYLALDPQVGPAGQVLAVLKPEDFGKMVAALAADGILLVPDPNGWVFDPPAGAERLVAAGDVLDAGQVVFRTPAGVDVSAPFAGVFEGSGSGPFTMRRPV